MDKELPLFILLANKDDLPKEEYNRTNFNQLPNIIKGGNVELEDNIIRQNYYKLISSFQGNYED